MSIRAPQHHDDPTHHRRRARNGHRVHQLKTHYTQHRGQEGPQAPAHDPNPTRTGHRLLNLARIPHPTTSTKKLRTYHPGHATKESRSVDEPPHRRAGSSVRTPVHRPQTDAHTVSGQPVDPVVDADIATRSSRRSTDRNTRTAPRCPAR